MDTDARTAVSAAFALALSTLALSLPAACGGKSLPDVLPDGRDAGTDSTTTDAGTDTGAPTDAQATDGCVPAPVVAVSLDTTTASEVAVALPAEAGALGLGDPSLQQQVSGATTMSFTVVGGPGDSTTELAFSNDGMAWTRDPIPAFLPPSPCDGGACPHMVAGSSAYLVDSFAPVPYEIEKLFVGVVLYDPGLTPPLREEHGYVAYAPSFNTANLHPMPKLRWNDDVVGGQDLRLIPALAACIGFSEPSAMSRDLQTLDLSLTCLTTTGRRVVLLRSADHGKTYAYVSTLFTEQDGLDLGGAVPEVTAAELFTASNVDYVVVSTRGPVKGSVAPQLNACITVRMSSHDQIARDCLARPLVVRRIVESQGRMLGSCSFAASVGYYVSVGYLGESARPYRIYRSGVTTP
ncbi:MAG TPA: hypothetical protein VF316_07365 [Polyangiaceae bacterium]